MGAAWLGLSQTQTGETQQKSFDQATKNLQTALKIKPDNIDALFNMACIEALQENEVECRNWLEKRVKIEPLSEKQKNDSDLDSVRDKVWFKKLSKG